MNVCMLGGYVAEKPEIRLTTTNASVAKFDVAVPRSYKTKDGKREYDYFSVEAWGNVADLVGKYYDKGTWINFRAEARVDKWVDQNNNKRYSTVFRVSEIFFGGQKSSGETQTTSTFASPAAEIPQSYTAAQPNNFEPSEGNDDLPF